MTRFLEKLSTTKKIVLGIITLVLISIAISFIRAQIRYQEEVERIQRRHDMEMQELDELENLYKNGNAHDKQKAYDELREKALRNGIPVDE